MTDKEVQRFLRAAAQRLTSAEILYRNDMYLDSTYLAGYVPECALKALILARQPSKNRADFVEQTFRTARGHDIEYLKALVVGTGLSLPSDVGSHLRRFATWSTDLRYAVGKGNRRRAQVLLQSARALLDWVNRSI